MSGPARVYRWSAVALAALALGCLPWPVQASAAKDFAAGVAASRVQDYAAALRHFEAAARAGMREPLLYYNLGVCYYREHRLDQAEQAFLEAARSPRLEAVSYYNLGLIARDLGRRELALTRFRQAEAAARSEQMRRLCALALQQMTGEQRPVAASAPWFLWAEGGVGYDSNAALATDFETRTGGRDETWNLSAYGHYDFTSLRVHGLLATERYSELGDFNFDVLETGISRSLERGDWRFRPGLSLRHMRVGNESFQDSGALLLQGAAEAGGFNLKFYLEHESITGVGDYGYLDGTRDYLRASAGTRDDRWRLVWDAEHNERADFSFANGEFFSFSPRRQQWQLEYRNPLTPALDLKLAAGVQYSKYRDPDIRLDDSGAITAAMRREDNRKQLILELGYRHRGDWRSRLELMIIERNSNFEEFEYDRGVLTLNVGRGFGG